MLPYMFYPYTTVPVYKRGHVDTTGMCGHSQSEETKRKIGKGSQRYWNDTEHSRRRIAKIAAANRSLSKRLASGTAVLAPGYGKKMSEIMLRQYASGERGPISWSSFNGCWLTTKKAGRIYCASSWEVVRAKVLDKDPEVLSFKRNSLRISYRYKAKQRTYFPDFVVVRRQGTFVEEVKGRIFDKKWWTVKKTAAELYCPQNGLKFVVLDSLRLVKQEGAPKL